MYSSQDEIAEILAKELYISAGLEPSFAVGAPRVAAAMLGERCVQAVPAKELPGKALLQRVGPRWVIYIREGLDARQLNHAIAHELGEWLLRCRGYVEADVEELSGRLAAAICVPRAAFLACHAQYGEDLAELGRLFRVSESLMALRVAECLGISTALVTRRVVRTRGAPREWPSTRDGWRELVKCTREQPNGMRLTTLGDAKGRVLLRVC